MKFVFIGILLNPACVGGSMIAMYLYAFGTAAQSTRIEVLRFSFAEATIGAGAKYGGYQK